MIEFIYEIAPIMLGPLVILYGIFVAKKKIPDTIVSHKINNIEEIYANWCLIIEIINASESDEDGAINYKNYNKIVKILIKNKSLICIFNKKVYKELRKFNNKFEKCVAASCCNIRKQYGIKNLFKDQQEAVKYEKMFLDTLWINKFAEQMNEVYDKIY